MSGIGLSVKFPLGLVRIFLGNPEEYLYFSQDFGKYWSGFYTKVSVSLARATSIICKFGVFH